MNIPYTKYYVHLHILSDKTIQYMCVVQVFKILISQDLKKVSITYVCNFVSVCLFKNNLTGHHTMAIAKILKYDDVCNFCIKCTYYVLIVRGERLALSNIDEW